MENSAVHLGLWLMSWGIRLGLPIDLPRHAPLLLAASHWFDFFGSVDGGMHLILAGKDRAGRRALAKWFIVAFDGDGPYIPTIPSVIMVKRMLAGETFAAGAMPCVGMITLQEYLDELKMFNIKTYDCDESD